MLRIWLSFAQEMLSQRDALFYWIPVFIAVGIGIFFSLSFEPSIFSLTFCAVLGMGLWAVGLFFDTVVRSIIWAVALIFAGFVVAGLRAHMVHAPTLGYRYYGEIEGRVIGIDRSASGALRITLDQVQLGKISKPRTPARIRLSLHGPPPEREPRIGDKLLTKGSVVPPQGPAEPGGFDFRRHAYFQGLGGVGYTRKAVELQNSDVTPLPLWFAKLRGTLSSRIKAELSQPVAGFAAAIMTGDRSGLAPSLVKDLRRTNLAHLLAISGLHMGLLVSVMLLAVRTLCLLLPVFITRLYAKKIAAFVALCTAAVYLGLSGGSISTQRAFVMVAVMLVAVLFDRRAISLRSVALAAAILLLLRPEALFSPGFQMSFAATTALVVAFLWWKDSAFQSRRKAVNWVLGVFLSSFVAGIATAPYAAYHFNLFSHVSLPANMLSVPLMGILVMPCAVLSFVLMPFGLEAFGLFGVRLGLEWIAKVALYFSGFSNATSEIVTPQPWVLPVLSLSVLVLFIWRGRFKWMSLVGISSVLLGWSTAQRPAVLIDQDAALVGILTKEGRALSKERGAGFIAEVWGQNDGLLLNRDEAFGLWQSGNMTVKHHWSKKNHGGPVHCTAEEIHVTRLRHAISGDCIIFDKAYLSAHGATAIWFGEDGRISRIAHATPPTVKRLWTPRKSGRYKNSQ